MLPVFISPFVVCGIIVRPFIQFQLPIHSFTLWKFWEKKLEKKSLVPAFALDNYERTNVYLDTDINEDRLTETGLVDHRIESAPILQTTRYKSSSIEEQRESWSYRAKNCSSSSWFRSVTRREESRSTFWFHRHVHKARTFKRLASGRRLASLTVRLLNVIYASESERPGFLSRRRYRSPRVSPVSPLLILALPPARISRVSVSLFAPLCSAAKRVGRVKTGNKRFTTGTSAIWQTHRCCIYIPHWSEYVNYKRLQHH